MKVAMPAADIDRFPWGQAIAVLIEPAADLLAVMWALGYARAADVELEASWTLASSQAGTWARQHAASLVTGIDLETRRRLAGVIADAMEAVDVTDEQLRGQIRDLFDEMSDSRARLIARTERSTAANMGNLAGYRSFGGSYVEVHDGITNDAACAAANGQIWPIAKAEANPLEHPNCGRSFSHVPADQVDPAMVAA